MSSATALNPIANPVEITTYTLTVTTPEGCTNSDVITVNVKQDIGCTNLMVAFTPNGDGINDSWIVGIESCYANAEVQVYNRYGSKVFNNDNYKMTGMAGIKASYYQMELTILLLTLH
ncbi:MAG: gliding motility-associated C-terminal domain-containing protein [Ferruginibacter sp.]